MIDKLLPVSNELAPLVADLRAVLKQKGESDAVAAVIKNMMLNAQMQARQGIDVWLSYGAYLPAVERIIALKNGEDEEAFLARTQYPINVIEAYSVPGDDLATLVAADQYSQMHKQTVLKNTGEWCLNEEQQHFINLYDYENRIKAV